MEKQFPFLFDDVRISAPFEPLSPQLSNVGRGRVGLFYKYGNRNGSYIDDKVAEMIIESAPTKPIIGFFDRSRKDFCGHTNQNLANGYGFISENPNFAWEKHLDKDGVQREYACFDVVFFSDYFPQAGTIVGHPQSMQLGKQSITGDWATIGDTEYFVYTAATLKGVCVLGHDVEPCFEGSSFFALNDQSKFDQFSALLLELRKKVENFEEGGEHFMNDENLQEIMPSEELAEEVNQEQFEDKKNPDEVKENENQNEDAQEKPEKKAEDKEQEPDDKKKDDYSVDYEELYKAECEKNKKACCTIEDLEHEVQRLKDEAEEYMKKLTCCQAEIDTYELNKKNQLIESYKNLLSDDAMVEINTNFAKTSYNDLEATLAIAFAHESIEKNRKPENKIPMADPEETEFSLLIKNYKI